MGSDVDVVVRAGVLQQQRWTLTVRDYCTGAVVRRVTGEASPSDPIRAAWRGGTDNGGQAAPGRYRLTLTSSGNGSSAWPYQRSVLVGVGGRSAAPSATSLREGASRHLRPAACADAALHDDWNRDHRTGSILGAKRKLDVPVLGRAGVPKSGVSAVAISVEAACASARTRVSVSPDTVTGTGARVLSLGCRLDGTRVCHRPGRASGWDPVPQPARRGCPQGLRRRLREHRRSRRVADAAAA